MSVLPEYDLTGKTAILATSGGGEAPFLAQALVEAGSSVFAVARTQALLDAVSASLPSGFGGAVMDAGGPNSAKAVMDQFDRSHDNVDILVNDHRSMFARPLEDIGADEWDAVQTRNTKATFLISQQVLPRMAKAEYGRVVNIISELAERGMINGSAFAASQAGILALTRSFAVEWSRFNIRVNAISAGPLQTLAARGISGFRDMHHAAAEKAPLKRNITVTEVAQTALFLCSGLSSGITGAIIPVDAGYHIMAV